jgi:predicted DCC family thiol-disulfide oxidoreductase YuxK
MAFPYSDGSPIYEVGVAVALIAGFVGIERVAGVRNGIGAVAERIASGLRRTGIFSSDISLSAEVHRLDLLRIVVGAMATWHYVPELRAAVALGFTGNVVWFGLTLVCCACFTIGLLTPIAAMALLLSLNILVVNYTLNVSIGSLAIAMCLIPMVIAPAGHTLSLDVLLLRRSRLMRAVYGIWGAPTLDRIQIGRFLALLAFAAINAYSALNHLQSETWLEGLTVATILLFPVINPKYNEIANSIYAAAPAIYVAFSKFATWGMLVWQLGMVPLALWRWTRPLTIVWGLIFFVFSAHVLAIKALGIYEYVLFAIVFWSRAYIDSAGRHGLMIFFDDRCKLCDRTVKTLSALDRFHRLDFRPISRNIELAASYGISEQEALTDLVGIAPKRSPLRGYDLYAEISRRVVLALPLFPVLLAGRVIGIGPTIYRFIADRRHRFFGVCELGTHRPRAEWTCTVSRECSVLATAVALSFVVLLLGYAARLPMVEEAFPDLADAAKSAIGRAPLAFGIGHIDVFNDVDLKIYRSIPDTYLHAPDGARLAITVPIGEVGHYKLTQDLRLAILLNKPCAPNWTEHWAEFVRAGTSPDDPTRKATVRAEFKVASHPSREDFLAWRYAPVTWDVVCVASTPVEEKE